MPSSITISVEQTIKEISNEILNISDGLNADNLETILKKFLDRILADSEFYCGLNKEMLAGIHSIYTQVNSAKHFSVNKQEADELFDEASKQLDEVLRTTEEATNEILGIVEKQQDLQPEANELIELASKNALTESQAKRLAELKLGVDDDLIKILTALSFQDLTGQRIKKIITTLEKIESAAYNLFMSTGLAVKAHKQESQQEVTKIKEETNQVVSELKGPTRDTDQKDVDNLLAELGL